MKKKCESRDSNLGYMGSKSTMISTTLLRPMHIRDKIIYAKVINRIVGKMCNPHQRKTNAMGNHSVAAKSMP